MLYVVQQKPKARYRGGLSTAVVLVEADSGRDAIRKACELRSEYIMPGSPECSKPVAFPAVSGIAWFA